MSEPTGNLRRLSITQASFQSGLYLGRHSGAVTVVISKSPFVQLSLEPSGGWEGPWRNS